MCGAFVAFAVGMGEGGPSRARLHAAYNAGRLVTYTTLGAVAGFLGGALDMAGGMVGVSRVAAMLAGATLVVFGGAHLVRAMGVRLAPARPPRWMARALRCGHAAAMRLPPVRRALAIGLLTTLLPCGWLYAFVAASAGTGSAPLGALTMAVFWLGTLPVLVAVGAGVRALGGPLGRAAPVVLPMLVIGAGLMTVFSRLGVTPEELAGVAGRVEATSVGGIADRVAGLDSGEMPCCAPGAGEAEAESPCACEDCAEGAVGER